MGHDSDKKSFALGALIGGLCGGITALLFSPKKGSEIRKDLSNTYREFSEKTSDLLEQTKHETGHMLDKAKSVLTNAQSKLDSKKRGKKH